MNMFVKTLAVALVLGQPAMAGTWLHGSAARSGVVITGVTINHIAAGNIKSGTAAWTSGNTYYYDGTVPNGTAIATLGATTKGGSFNGTFSVTGTDAACFQISGTNLQTAGSCGGGATGSVNIVATQAGASGSPFTQSVTVYAGQNYYISPAGSDANTGLSTSAPWLTWNHPVNCGDWINAAPGTYALANFQTPGVSTCPGNDDTATLECVTPFSCTISGSNSATGAVDLTQNFWGVIGFVLLNTSGSCVKGSPPGGVGSTVHHLLVANSIVQNCFGSGIQFGNYGGSGNGTDYENIIGVLSYANSWASGPCFSGVSLAGESNSDTLPGTHRYLARIIAWHNINGSNCNGTNNTTDGEGIIYDQPQINDTQGQMTAENNLLIGNGSAGFENFAAAPAAGSVTTILRNNTIAGNMSDKYHTASTNMEILLAGETNATYNISVVEGNIAASYANVSGASNAPTYAVLDSYLMSASSAIDGDWLFGQNAQNIINFHTGYTCPLGGSAVPTPSSASNVSCSHVQISTDPVFAGAAYCTGSIAASSTTLTVSGCTGAALAAGMQIYVASGTPFVPGATLTSGSGASWTVSTSQSTALNSVALVFLPIPAGPPANCSGQADVLACMSSTIAAFTPTVSGANSYGYNVPAACDANNSTPFIQNSTRMLPSSLDPCG